MTKKKAKAKGRVKPEKPTDDLPELSERHLKFIAAYLENGGNGTQACKSAGYRGNDKTLGVQAVRLLANASIQAFIRLKRQEVVDRIDEWVIDEASILQRLASHAYTSIKDVMGGGTGVDLRSYKDIDDKHAFAIKAVSETHGEGGQSMSITMHDPCKAIELLVKYKNLFPNQAGAKQDANSGRDANKIAVRTALERLRNRFRTSGDGGGSGTDGNPQGGG